MINDSKIKDIIGGIDINKFIEIVTSNGNYRRSITTEGAKKGFEEVSYVLFKEAKNQIGEELYTDLDEMNNRIKINNSKKSIRSVLRVIGYRDRITLDKKHIIEGPADNIIK